MRSLQGSPDGNAANLVDLTTDAMGTLTVNQGKRTVERTRASDSVARHDPVKGDPSVEMTFDVDPASNRAWGVFFNNDGPHAWDIKISDGSGGNVGVHGSGVASVEGPTMTINHTDGTAQFTVTLRPVGADFAWDSDIS